MRKQKKSLTIVIAEFNLVLCVHVGIEYCYVLCEQISWSRYVTFFPSEKLFIDYAQVKETNLRNNIHESWMICTEY